jgi:hypothetical protein
LTGKLDLKDVRQAVNYAGSPTELLLTLLYTLTNLPVKAQEFLIDSRRRADLRSPNTLLEFT